MYCEQPVPSGPPSSTGGSDLSGKVPNAIKGYSQAGCQYCVQEIEHCVFVSVLLCNLYFD